MNVVDAARTICLSFPEVEEYESHSMPNFKVRKKTFATLALNHHGDGRVALWLEAPAGSQKLHVEFDSCHYFVPPYVGTKGWLGIELNKDLDWKAVIQRVSEAFQKIAPAELLGASGNEVEIKEPVRKLKEDEIDVFKRADIARVVKKAGSICESLPEVSASRQFGNPVWKAGKKTFVCLHRYDATLKIQVWVGAERQSFLVEDPRYSIPAYVGHNGWIDLRLDDKQSWPEVESLILESYRHFALKRMLKQLPQGDY